VRVPRKSGRNTTSNCFCFVVERCCSRHTGPVAAPLGAPGWMAGLSRLKPGALTTHTCSAPVESSRRMGYSSGCMQRCNSQ
jgi:hypothetical protein